MHAYAHVHGMRASLPATKGYLGSARHGKSLSLSFSLSTSLSEENAKKNPRMLFRRNGDNEGTAGLRSFGTARVSSSVNDDI